MAKQLEKVFERAYVYAHDNRHEYVTIEHLLWSLLEETEIQNVLISVNAQPSQITNDVLNFLSGASLVLPPHIAEQAPKRTNVVERTVQRAFAQVMLSNQKEVTPIILLLSILSEEHSHAHYFLTNNGVTREAIVKTLRETNEPGADSPLKTFCRNLNTESAEGHIDPVIGREKEVADTIEILARRKKNNVMYVGEPGVGKAQPLHSKIKTPNGWVTMGDIKVGDIVSCPDGSSASVSGVFPQGKKDIYKFTFSDGRTAEACGEHLWDVFVPYGKKRHLTRRTLTTKELLPKIHTSKGVKIPVIEQIDTPGVDLPIDPYVLGVLLGDGSFADTKVGMFWSGDIQVANNINERLETGYEVGKLGSDPVGYNIVLSELSLARKGHAFRKNQPLNYYHKAILDLGLCGTLSHTKFVPSAYKNASLSQRLDLLAGMVDSDGEVGENGSISISTASEEMAKDIQEIVWSIGGISKISTRTPTYTYLGETRQGRISYKVTIRYPEPTLLSKLGRKVDRLPLNYQYWDLKLKISDIKLVGEINAQCIMVDHPDHLYITDDYVVTHNTALAEGLARKISEGDVPPSIKDKIVYSLDLSAMIAGTKFRGEFEERFKATLKEIVELGNVILFIDEIHMIMGAGATTGNSMDAGNIMKPMLANGQLMCVGATTYEEYATYIEKDRALMRRFKKYDIEQPSVEDTKLILGGLEKYYTEFHGITYAPEVLNLAVDLSMRYLKNQVLPDKAIDIMDAAGAKAKLEEIAEVNADMITATVAKMAKIPIGMISVKENTEIKELGPRLNNTVFGQSKAIETLIDAITVAKAGIRDPNKPQGSFLFTGPTGVGKTFVCQKLAEFLGVELVRFDMSEYMEKHSVSKLIGAPPGYVGHGEGKMGDGMLVSAVETNPTCVLLLDEVEKAHPDVMNVLLQIMDNGSLTSSRGKKVSFSNVILVMTSNLGAFEAEKTSIGFIQSDYDDTAAEEAVKKFFSPEFRNRLDETVNFDKLQPEHMYKIVDAELKLLISMVESKGVLVTLTPPAREWLAKHGYNPKMGARPLGRLFQDKVKKPLSKLIVFGDLGEGGRVKIEVVNDDISISKMRDVVVPPVTS